MRSSGSVGRVGAGLIMQPVPWRTIALLALLGLLLAAAVTLYVGSRPRLPAPFGPAANGLVAYGQLGEIWTVDPLSGERKKVVSLTGGNEATCRQRKALGAASNFNSGVDPCADGLHCDPDPASPSMKSRLPPPRKSKP